MDAFRAQLDELMGKDRNLLVRLLSWYFVLLIVYCYSPTKRKDEVSISVTQIYAKTTFVDFALLNSSQTQRVI
jgi:hypothetical protein